jgi:hypothetical protein
MLVEVVRECGRLYNFDAEEAMLKINLVGGDKVINNKVINNKVINNKKSEKVVKENKLLFPLPYDGERVLENCSALKKCEGLYTQCCVIKVSGKEYCKQCDSQCVKNGGKAVYGRIEDRQAVGVMEYCDPKGVKVVSFKKVMKKLKLSREDVLAEALRIGVTILEVHLEEEESDDSKKKGRPKKVPKVLEIDGDDTSDIFAELVANADSLEEEVEVEVEEEEKPKWDWDECGKNNVPWGDEVMKSADNESKVVEKEMTKQEKAAKLAQDKLDKAAKIEQDKLDKAAKIEQDKQEKAAKALKLEEEKAAKALKLEDEKKAKAEKALKLEEEKAAKALKLEEEKAAKALKLEEEKAAKALKLEEDKKAKALKLEEDKKAKAPKVAVAVAKEEKAKAKPADENKDVVKRIEFEGKKYLKSQKTGIVYNLNEDIIGKYDEVKKIIIFNEVESDSEEEEEEYEA